MTPPLVTYLILFHMASDSVQLRVDGQLTAAFLVGKSLLVMTTTRRMTSIRDYLTAVTRARDVSL